MAAAGLSGAAQAAHLAGGGVEAASPAVRFGIGAAPAVAAAAVAHLLHLIRSAARVTPDTAWSLVQAEPVRPPELVQEGQRRTAPTLDAISDRLGSAGTTGACRPAVTVAASRTSRARPPRSARGSLPTTTELARLSGASRGTAGTVLKGLRTSTTRTAPTKTSVQPRRARRSTTTGRVRAHSP